MKTAEFKYAKQAGFIGKPVATFWTLCENSDQLPVVIFPFLELEVNGIGTFIIVAKIENGVFYHMFIHCTLTKWSRLMTLPMQSLQMETALECHENYLTNMSFRTDVSNIRSRLET